MAWLGEGLSTLRGQITSVANFTKEVLSDGKDDDEGDTTGHGASAHTTQELEEYCTLKDLEISNLRERCKHLESLVESSSQKLQSQSIDNSISEDGQLEYLSAESWNQHETQSSSFQSISRSREKPAEVPKNYVLVPEEKEVTLMRRIDHLEAENKLMRKTCFEYEEQVAELLEQRMKYGSSTSEESTELGKLGDLQPTLLREPSQEDLSNVFREQLQASEYRIIELETELQKVQRQLLDQLGDTQASASEMRGVVHETRRQLMEDSDAQAGSLQDRKRLTNEIYRLGEKRQEAEAKLKILTSKRHHLSVDVTNIIQKIGDAEQQEFIHGALNALELENQILKLRNAQLELAAGSPQKGIDSDEGFKGDHFNIGEDILIEPAQPDADNSEFEELRMAKQCLTVELESMAILVQNLEVSQAHLQEENASLSTSLEELDQQHQGAVDQLLQSKKALQIENNSLSSEIEKLNLKLADVSNQLKTGQSSPVPSSIETATETSDLEATCQLQQWQTFEDETYAKILKLISFELPKEYHNNKKYDLDSMSLVKTIVKNCEESRWKKETLERKVAELMKGLRDSEKGVKERDDRILSLEEEAGILKSSITNDALAVIPENSEDVELLEQRAFGLETELKHFQKEQGRLLALVDQLEKDAINYANKLEEQESVVTGMKSKLEQALACQNALENEKIALIQQMKTNTVTVDDRECLEKDYSRLEKLLAENKILLENENARNHQLELRESKQNDQIAGLREELDDRVKQAIEFDNATDIEIKKLQKDFLSQREELENSVLDISKKLTEVTEANIAKDVNYEISKSTVKSLENVIDQLSDQIRSSNREIEELKVLDGEHVHLKKKLIEKENELAELRTSADATIKKLENQHEEYSREKAELEAELEAERVRLVTLQEWSLDSSVLQSEVERWKTMATASERQLDEALQAQSELEDECKRLFAIETKVQKQEHLEREMAQLIEMTRTTEERLSDALQSKETLEHKLQQLKSSLDDQKGLEQEAREWRETNSATEHKLQDMLSANSKLIAEISRLKDIETESSKNLGVIEILEHQLNNAMAKNSGLEEKLDISTGHLQRLQHLDQEIVEWKDKARVSESQLKEALMRKHEIKKENKRLEEALKNIDVEKHDQEKPHEFEPKDNSAREERNNVVLEQSYQLSESSEMARETIANLSKIIKEKDLELEAMSLKTASLVRSLQQENKTNAEDEEKEKLQREVAQVRSERDEIIQTVQKKQEESVKYYNEIQRLNVLLNNELAKSAQAMALNSGLKQQYEDKQKLLLNTQNELIAVKQRLDNLEQMAGSPQHLSPTDHETADFQSIEAKNEVITMKTQLAKELGLQLQVREDEILMLKEQISELRNSRFGTATTDGQVVAPDLKKQRDSLVQDLQTERVRLLDCLQQETTRNKYLQCEVQEQHEKESSLSKELTRLREHLVSVEDTYTQETINNEESMKELKAKLSHAEDQIKNCSTAYTSANIRANQHVESLQDQTRLIVQQRDDMQAKLSAAEDQVQKHAAALRNLQGVLEQFQNDKQMEIICATSKLEHEMQWLKECNGKLSSEMAALNVHLAEAKEGLSAASRLGEQLDKKTETIARLKEEVQRLNEQLNSAETREKSATQSSEGKVDKYLVKNLLIGYLVSSEHTKLQALRIVATVLDFNHDERGRVGLEPGAQTTSWFSSLLHPGSGSNANQSLSEAFVRFLESESRPQPQLRLLPAIKDTPLPKTIVDVTAGSSQSPILLSEVQLPTFTQFPVARNSSSILKDVLKDS